MHAARRSTRRDHGRRPSAVRPPAGPAGCRPTPRFALWSAASGQSPKRSPTLRAHAPLGGDAASRPTAPTRSPSRGRGDEDLGVVVVHRFGTAPRRHHQLHQLQRAGAVVPCPEDCPSQRPGRVSDRREEQQPGNSFPRRGLGTAVDLEQYRRLWLASPATRRFRRTAPSEWTIPSHSASMSRGWPSLGPRRPSAATPPAPDRRRPPRGVIVAHSYHRNGRDALLSTVRSSELGGGPGGGQIPTL